MSSNSDPILEMYIYESLQMTEQLEELLLSAEKNVSLGAEQINEVFRIMHTIKGSSAMMSFNNISKVAHVVEDLFYLIRDNTVDPTDEQWASIFDLVLRSNDFMKGEVEEIQNTGASVRDEAPLVSDIKAFVDVLKGVKPVAESASTPSAPSPKPHIGSAAGEDEPTEGDKVYKVIIHFEDDCKMENIRAFGVVTSLKNIASAIITTPSNLDEDVASEEISSNGLIIYIQSNKDVEELKGIISETLFLKSYEFTEATDKEEIPPVMLAAFEMAQAPLDEAEGQAAVEETEQAVAVVADKPVVEAVKQAVPDGVPASDGASKQSFISVNLDKLDKLLDLVGEIVIHEAMVVKSSDLAGLQLENFEKSARELNKLTSELQNIVMSVRMIPISSTFRKMQRIVRDMCKKVNKEVELVIIGEETEIDKNIIDNLSDPLMHLIRNGMDHGIESPDVRRAAGKSPKGTITLEAKNSGSDVLISILDDGAGLNKEKIVKKAIEKGLTYKSEAEISDKEAFSFILLPGFSTKEQVTEFSGRGVGMDVVKRNLDNVGGVISIDSQPGKGTSIFIKIPLTLAIVEGMEVSVADRGFIVPINNIQVSKKVQKEEILVDPTGREMVQIHGEFYPVVRLHKKFMIDTEITDIEDGIIMLLSNDDRSVCIFVDKLIGEQQIVVKPIPSYVVKKIGHIHGIGGCTLLGDGRISLILDINDICE